MPVKSPKRAGVAIGTNPPPGGVLQYGGTVTSQGRGPLRRAPPGGGTGTVTGAETETAADRPRFLGAFLQLTLEHIGESAAEPTGGERAPHCAPATGCHPHLPDLLHQHRQVDRSAHPTLPWAAAINRNRSAVAPGPIARGQVAEDVGVVGDIPVVPSSQMCGAIHGLLYHRRPGVRGVRPEAARRVMRGGRAS